MKNMPSLLHAGLAQARDRKIADSPGWCSVTLEKSNTVRDLFVSAGGSLLRHLQTHVEGVLDKGNSDCLHQVRIAVRRLRTLLWLYRGLLQGTRYKALTTDLKWLGQALALARDTEVLMHDIWPTLSGCLPAKPIKESLDAAWKRDLQRGARRCLSALRSARYRRVLDGMRAALAAAVSGDCGAGDTGDPWGSKARHFMRRRLHPLMHRVRKRAKDIDYRDASAVHRLRIAVKRLRYALDTAGPLYKTGRIMHMRRALSHLQDVLGDMHDCSVAVERTLLALAAEQRQDAIHLARNRVCDWEGNRQRALLCKLKSAMRLSRRADII